MNTTDWIVTGNEIIAWVDDLQFFDITFDAVTETFALRINHLALASTIYLGQSDSVKQAMRRAQDFVGHGTLPEFVGVVVDDDLIEITCSHGLSMVQVCPECAQEFGGPAGGLD